MLGRKPFPSYVQHAKECSLQEYKSCGEPSYAAYVATQLDIPFVSGDPSDNDILPFLFDKNYSSDDLIGYRLIQFIPQWRRAGELDFDTTPTRLEKRAVWYSQKLKSKNIFTFQSLKEWFTTKTGLPFDWNKIGTSTVSPEIGPQSTNLNKLSYNVDLARNAFLLKKIEENINTRKKVLVIFGQGHLVMLRPALEEALGKSTDKKVY